MSPYTIKGYILMTTRSLKRLGIALVACCMLLAAARAQGTKIGVVDIDRVVSESKSVSAAVKKTQDSVQKRNDEIQARYKELQSARADLERRRSVMSEEQAKNEDERLTKQEEEVKDMAYAADKEMARVRQKVMDPEFKRIMSAVEEIAKRDGYDLILPKRAALYSADRIDITPMVIQLLDKAGASSIDNNETDEDSKPAVRSTPKPSSRSNAPSGRARPRVPRDND